MLCFLDAIYAELKEEPLFSTIVARPSFGTGPWPTLSQRPLTSVTVLLEQDMRSEKLKRSIHKISLIWWTSTAFANWLLRHSEWVIGSSMSRKIAEPPGISHPEGKQGDNHGRNRPRDCLGVEPLTPLPTKLFFCENVLRERVIYSRNAQKSFAQLWGE